MGHLVLIDGHHLLYRAYWAIPRTLTMKNGDLVNTAFGVASMLLAILKKEEPDMLLFCFDEGEETFRHTEYSAYKEGRAKTPDDFYDQIPRTIAMLEAIGVKMTSHAGFEADDFLCAYAKLAEESGHNVTIVTGDRDALQLASTKTRIAIPHKGYNQAEYLGPLEIEAKYGIRPDQVPAYKGLTGDSSDNLPGVQGIGPKTAADLLMQFDTLENLYAHLEDVRPAVRAKLEKDKEQAFFCERMAQLVCDMDLEWKLDDLALQDLRLDTASDAFRTLEFTMLTNRLHDLARSEYGKRIFDETSLIADPTLKQEDQMTLF